MTTLVIRPAQAADLPALTELLPAFAREPGNMPEAEPESGWWLACVDARPVASLRARQRIGLQEPRYWFHVGQRVHAASELSMYRRDRTLLLGNDHTGAAELGEFALDRSGIAPAMAETAVQQLFAHALHWLRARPRQADELPRIIAALPGLRASDGAAIFWRGLGRHFFAGDADEALARFGLSWKSQVATLLPKHPLVASLLDRDTQLSIGALHPDARIWAEALQSFGFTAGQHIDLHDGGPVYEAPFDAVVLRSAS